MPANRWMSVADPIHGIIQFDRHDESHRLVLEVVNSRAFQRLRRIKQMGLAEFVFPNATHSRFVHSLGATHLMVQTINHFHHIEHSRKLLASSYEDTGIPLSRLLLLGILIHDIGHSPLSHTLEDILGLKHQDMHHDHYWNKKVLQEDEELQRIWEKYGPELPHAVTRFTEESRRKHFLAYLISSQLDMDRLDYLQRDSHFLGVKYGQIEVQRIISNLEIVELREGHQVVAVREEAIPAVEHYLFGRHEAYKMALHALDKASEATLKKVLERFRWARERNLDTAHPAEELFKLMTEGKALNIRQYLRMDDCYIWEAINSWSLGAQDPLLRELASRMMKHEILKFVDLRSYGITGFLRDIPEVFEALRHHYKVRNLSFEFGYDELEVMPKAMYLREDRREPIWISTRNQVVDLREVSSLPLEYNPMRGQKHLVFVWDREARHFLHDTLNRYLKTRREPLIQS
jgi:uncharacterized protein